jgi:signal transduction histidine kinase/HAMP domain-containing protein
MTLAGLRSSLRVRAAAGVVLALAAAIALVFLLQYRWLHREAVDRISASASSLSDIIKAGLEHTMQSRDHAALEAILAEARRHEDVAGVFVVDKTGVIRVSANPADVGRQIPLADPTCQVCHATGPQGRSHTVILPAASGERVFRNVNPIANGPRCAGCHAGSGALNGVLITDLSMRQLDARLLASRRDMLIALVVAIGAAGVAITLVLDRLVIARVRTMGAAIARLASGRLDATIPVGARDEIGAVGAAFNDLVERLRRANTVRERKELLESVLNHIADAVLVFAPDASLMAVNRAGEHMLDASPGPARGRDVLGPGQGELLMRTARAGPFVTELTLHAAGRTFPARLHVIRLEGEAGAPLATVAIVHDLTAERAREDLHAQLVDAEKLAAVGRLAAGVAHELNNPLGNLLLHAKLLQEDGDDPAAREGNARRVVDNALRCKAVVRALLDYARPAAVERRWTSVDDLVRVALGAVAPDAAARNAVCRTRAAPDLPRIWCDRYQIEQVLVNLLQNAVDAIDEHGHVVVFADADGPDAVILGVEDDGPGIPEEMAARVFEPFYTTKHRGTGLGLSIARTIVEGHRGRMWAERGGEGPRPGARFVVRLPVGEAP